MNDIPNVIADTGVRDIAVAALFVHPLKSAARIPVQEMALDERGARGDRRWMLVDRGGTAITQRDHARLALVQPSFVSDDRDGALRVSAPSMGSILLPVPRSGERRHVQVWDDTTTAVDVGDDAAGWMSEAIGAHCRVVRLADDAERLVAARYTGDVSPVGRHVALSDGAPLLLLGQGSLDALNVRLLAQGGKALGDDRFRPNVLLTGTAPHEEDTWSRIEIGALSVGVGSSCARCVVTTIDQQSIEQGVEPLRTLATYRREGGKVVFAVNAAHAAPGVLHVGDRVRVVGFREALRRA